MSISPLKRIYRRAKRRARHQWQVLDVTFCGNRIIQRTNFDHTIEHPILLLQGFGSTRRSLHILETRLRADGYEVLSIRLGGLFGTLNTRRIDQAAKLVLEKIVSLRQRYPLGPLTIIGFSKGGLIGRYLVACLGGHAHVARLITLATPHQGLPIQQHHGLTHFGLALRSVRQMRPTSSLFQCLNSSPMPGHIPCVSLASQSDPIAPASICHWAAIGEGAEPDNIVFDGVSHSDFLIKQRVYDTIRTYLPPLQGKH